METTGLKIWEVLERNCKTDIKDNLQQSKILGVSMWLICSKNVTLNDMHDPKINKSQKTSLNLFLSAVINAMLLSFTISKNKYS